jgi:hypothetical protein
MLVDSAVEDSAQSCGKVLRPSKQETILPRLINCISQVCTASDKLCAAAHKQHQHLAKHRDSTAFAMRLGQAPAAESLCSTSGRLACGTAPLAAAPFSARQIRRARKSTVGPQAS